MENTKNPKKSRQRLNIMKALKVLNRETDDDKVITFDEPLMDNEGMAFFCSNGVYKNLFGKNKKDESQDMQRLSVIKIKKGKRCIYRKFVGKGISKLDTNSVGLSANSWQQLCLDDGNDVEVTKSCRFPFFWYHPNSATRVSFRMGVISISLAIIGIGLSILFNL